MAEDDFDVETLATFLHLTPDVVRKMANRGKLPGRRINDKWIFSSAEIHHWFEEKIGVSDQEELKQVEKVLKTQKQSKLEDRDRVLTISELLPLEMLEIPLASKTKTSVINSMCELAANAGYLWDPTKMREAIKARERLHPTALENGVALLHPRRPMPSVMEASFLALGITNSGIPFGGPRGTLTDIFFLICSSCEESHLRVLARLSRLVGQIDLLDRIRQVSSKVEARDMLVEADEMLD